MKLRYISYLLIFSLILTSCGREKGDIEKERLEKQLSSLGASAEITFKDHVKHIGTISEGEKIMTYFQYENTGSAALIITSIKAGCGCTVPKWSEEPLKPGESENIKVIFDSSGKKGTQNIRISVKSNARNSDMNLVIKGVVKEN